MASIFGIKGTQIFRNGGKKIMSNYFNVYKAAKPLVKMAGQKSVKTIKSAAKQAQEKNKTIF